METTIWTDATGQQWDAAIRFEDWQRLKASGFDILDPSAFESSFGDPLKIVEVLAELHRTQWEAKGLKYEQFADLIIEGSFGASQAAFVAAVANFTRNLGRNAQAVLVERAFAAVRAVDGKATEQIQQINFEAIAEAEGQKLANALKSFGS